jgi:predicted ester cyclase
VLEDGDKITIRFTLSRRHEGAFLGVPATGTEIVLPGITILRFGAAGKTVERWSNADMLGLLVQLGAVPAPA